jgi:excisionase family DNA binding protein
MTAVPLAAHASMGNQLYRIPEAMRVLSLSRSVIYDLMRSGRLRSVRQGRARLIPATAIADYIALLEREAAQEVTR